MGGFEIAGVDGTEQLDVKYIGAGAVLLVTGGLERRGAGAGGGGGGGAGGGAGSIP